MYQRIAGIEAGEPGYETFRIKPVVGGGLTWAEGSTETPYGRISSKWKIENGRFYLEAEVPVGTKCTVILPDGSVKEMGSGTYRLECAYAKGEVRK